ncbi:MAG: class I SAM-dependent methyltransferase [Acidimicrobiia bacterium]
MYHLFDHLGAPPASPGPTPAPAPAARLRRRTVTSWPAFFGALGGEYDRFAFGGAALTRVAEGETKLLADAIGAGDGRGLLDVGAGTGRFSTVARDQGWQVTAFDAAPEMLDVIRQRLPEVRTVEGSLGAPLPFENAAFDAVIAMRVVKYVPDAQAALAELARVLAPGGSLLFDLANGRSLARFGYPGGTISFVSPRAVAPLLRSVGLLPVGTYAGPRLPHPVYRRARGTRSATALASVERALDAVLLPGTGARNLIVHAVRSR